MTRNFFLVLLVTSLVWETSITAQTVIQNYYNAPSSLGPPGLPGGTFPSFQSGPRYFGTSRPTQAIAPVNYVPGYATTTTVPGYATTTGTTTTTPILGTSVVLPQTSTIPTAVATTPGIAPSGSVIQQIYPQPAQPAVTQPFATTAAPLGTGAPLQIAQLPLQYVAPPDAVLPGFYTIKDSKWTLTDYFYDMPAYIGVKVEVVRPEGRYVPLSDRQLENRVKSILQESFITTELLDIPCQPPSPMFYVLVMAYPCDKRCVAFITIQYHEIVIPQRLMEIAIDGIWQGITWEKQALVASSCDDFAQEVGETIDQFTRSFAKSYRYYHPVEEQPCFDTEFDP